jgi:hypothetical protein
MREDTPNKKALRLKDSLRKRESRAREHSLTRLARRSSNAASTQESRAKEDSPTRLARRSRDASSTEESRAKEDTPTRLARRFSNAASTQESRAKEDSPTRLARQSEDNARKKVKRSDPEENLKEAAARREAREKYRVLTLGETHGMKQDPRKGQLAMYAATRTYEEVRNDPGQSDEDLLAPISVEEVASLIRRFKQAMNPRSTIYTCASCGIREILPEKQPPYKLPIRDLGILKLSEDQRSIYYQYPVHLRRLRSVTACTNNELYFLSRPHVEKACDDRTDMHADDPISPDIQAFMCKYCFQCLNTDQSKQKIRIFSLASGVEFSLIYAKT